MTRYLAYAIEAFEAIWRNRARSALTMLGMIIGTASVITVLGIGNAASSGIKGSLDAFGNPGYFVSADTKQDDPLAAQIQYRDVASVLAANRDRVRYAFPSFQRNYHIKAGGVDYVGFVQSQTDVVFDTIATHEGRRIDAADVGSAAHVVVLSQALERRLFGSGSALGQKLRIDGVPFRCVGVYDDLKAGIFTSAGASDYADVPYSTFQHIAPGPIDALQVYPQPGATLAEVGDAVEATLRHIHGPRARYEVRDSVAFLGAFERVVEVVGYGLTGIGIMNIMLVSVNERTRESGIRMALGAGSRDITTQFLMEALILSLLGGGTGLAIGISAVSLAYGLVSSLLGPAPIPWLFITSLAVGFSVLVGVVFGTYPALRAGKLDPIEALRS
ncbi:MAG: ABC transporter permease [Vulcanimicrobiaceae bacterium]